MIKQTKDILMEMHNKSLGLIIDLEVQIEYLKTRKPEEVLFSEPTMVLGRPAQKTHTAQDLITAKEKKLEEETSILRIVEKRLKEYEKEYEKEGKKSRSIA